jgi:hypothetical protein
MNTPECCDKPRSFVGGTCDYCGGTVQPETHTHTGCTASALGWAIKYSNIRELAVRLIQAKGRYHTQKAYEELREFISSENNTNQ